MLWGDYSHEAAVTAQALYVLGLLDVEEFEDDKTAFDARIGRGHDEVDLNAGCIRVLFESGLELLHIGPSDYQRMITDIDYWREELVALNDLDPADEATMPDPEVHSYVAQRLEAILACQREFPSQYQEIKGRAEIPADITGLLAQGYIIHGGRRYNEPGVGGFEPILITRIGTAEELGVSELTGLEPGVLWEISSPEMGLEYVSPTPANLRRILPTFTAVRRPLISAPAIA